MVISLPQILAEQTRNYTRQYLAKSVLDDLTDSNNVILAAISCLKSNHQSLAKQLFEHVAAAGPRENAKHHFAYIRSLIELAELSASNKDFGRAIEYMQRALEQYPNDMLYMMSKVHLKVYFSYYLFQYGREHEALSQLDDIIKRRSQRFDELSLKDAYCIVGPSLCYAIHQKALFFYQKGKWQEAVDELKQIVKFTDKVDQVEYNAFKDMYNQGVFKEAFTLLENAVKYES